MSPDEATQREEELAAMLAAYDEALATGTSLPLPSAGPLDLESLSRLRHDQDCLDLLERVWPRGHSTDKEPAPAAPAEEPVPIQAHSLPLWQRFCQWFKRRR